MDWYQVLAGQKSMPGFPWHSHWVWFLMATHFQLLRLHLNDDSALLPPTMPDTALQRRFTISFEMCLPCFSCIWHPGAKSENKEY